MSSFKKLAVFDIDGTITQEGNDSWFETTTQMVTDTKAFEGNLATWKMNKSKDPYGASLIMMEQAISLFPNNTDSKLVFEKARAITEEAARKNQIRKSAVAAIHKHFNEGLTVVFATTSYMEAGLAVLEVLAKSGLITEAMRKAIPVSGTEVNWDNRKIVHFNMSEGKIQGVAKVLKTEISTVKENILYAYGDDPLGNDSGILSAAANGFIINTSKNLTLDTNHIGERIQW